MKIVGIGVGLVATAVLGLLSCNGDDPASGPGCAEPDPSAAVDVNGTYRYVGALRGTITLVQTGNTVELTNTTYENADDRPVVGSADLDGNVLDIVLVPENGDPDYRADVRFVFDNGGDTFCVSFSDTNDDVGGLGSYTGVKQ